MAHLYGKICCPRCGSERLYHTISKQYNGVVDFDFDEHRLIFSDHKLSEVNDRYIKCDECGWCVLESEPDETLPEWLFA